MIIEDSFSVPAAPKAVWRLLLDIPAVSECFPGVEEVETIAPDTYRGVMTVRIGPFSASFSGRTTIEADGAERQVRAQVEAEDPRASSNLSAVFTGDVSPEENGTRLEYQVDIALRGRLAQFGSAVVKATAKKLTREFARCLADRLEASSPTSAE